MPGSLDRFDRIDQERNRARGPRAAQEPLAIPGYRSGFNITLDVNSGQVTLHPGVIAVRGQLVSVPDSIGLSESEVNWVQARRQAQLYYVYIDVDGQVSVDIAIPQYDRDTFTYVNPVYNRRIVVGHVFVGNNKAILHASPGHQPSSSAVVASVSYEGPANYYCDGYDDDKEINTAIAFQMQANRGGIILLSAGIFNASEDVDVLGAFITLEGRGRSTIIKGADIAGNDNLSQVRDLTHIYGGTTKYYTSWGGTVTTTSGLESDVEAERLARIAAIAQEKADRTDADALEAAARQAADDDEAAARAQAVAAEAAQRAVDLRAEAASRVGDVAAEEAARKAEDEAERLARIAAIAQEVADRTDADELEAKARKAADDDEGAARAAAVAAEAAARAAALADEAAALAQEVADRTDADELEAKARKAADDDEGAARAAAVAAEAAARAAALADEAAALAQEVADRTDADELEAKARKAADDDEAAARAAAVAAEAAARAAALKAVVDAGGGGVAAEAAARKAADEAERLARIAAIAQEVADRTDADELEAKARKAADDDEGAARAAAVAAEAAARAAALADEAAALAQEVADRTDADELEAKARKAADDDEAAARAAAVAAEAAARAAALKAVVDAGGGGVAAEAAARKAADEAERLARIAAIAQEVADRTDADELEAKARKAADDDEAAALAQEIADRTDADALEVAARKAAVDALAIPTSIGDLDTTSSSSLELASDQSLTIRSGSSYRIVVDGTQISIQRKVGDSWEERVEISASSIIIGEGNYRINITSTGIALQSRGDSNSSWFDILDATSEKDADGNVSGSVSTTFAEMIHRSGTTLWRGVMLSDGFYVYKSTDGGVTWARRFYAGSAGLYLYNYDDTRMFYVGSPSGNASFSKNLHVKGDVVVDDDLRVGEDVTIYGDLGVVKDAVVSEDLRVGNDLRVDGDVKISGKIYLDSHYSVDYHSSVSSMFSALSAVLPRVGMRGELSGGAVNGKSRKILVYSLAQRLAASKIRVHWVRHHMHGISAVAAGRGYNDIHINSVNGDYVLGVVHIKVITGRTEFI